MSMNFGKIMELCEATSGFGTTSVGERYEDTMPALTLSECMHEMTISLMEAQIEALEESASSNEIMLEATIAAVQTGDTDRLTDLVEASVKGLKEKVMAIFERIKKWLMAIVAKLELFIDKIVKSNKDLLAKYKGDERIVNGKFGGMKYKGYRFNPAAKFNHNASADTLIKAFYGNAEAADISKFNTLPGTAADLEAKTKEASDAANVISDIANAERERRIVSVIASCPGFDISKEGWKENLKKALYGNEGEKVEMEFGKDFDISTIYRDMEASKDLGEIKGEYKTMIKRVDEAKAQYANITDAIEAHLKEASKVAGKEEGGKELSSHYNSYVSAVANLIDKQVGVYSAVTGSFNDVKNIELHFYQAKNKQAREQFLKLLSYKGKDTTKPAEKKEEPKAKTEHSDFEGIEDFDFEI